MGAERTYRTDTGEAGGLPVTVVRELDCRLKRFTSTDEGKIALAIELDARDEETLAQLRSLIEVQQGDLRISIAGLQGELDL